MTSSAAQFLAVDLANAASQWVLTADMAETVAGVSKEHPELEAGHAATVALAELGLPIVTTNPAPPPGTDDIPKSPLLDRFGEEEPTDSPNSATPLRPSVSSAAATAEPLVGVWAAHADPDDVTVGEPDLVKKGQLFLSESLNGCWC